MKLNVKLALATLATFALAVWSPQMRATAATFDQTEVAQEKYIAIAVPLASGQYKLLILEQISATKQCWSESGAKPVVIDPLLLNFDFTGICGRGTDSNGYSIRVAGRDLALDYGLRLERRDGELVLLGLPHSGRKGEALVIGKTGGISSQFMKIQLDPGWKFTRRSFNGKVLGHVYLTRDHGGVTNDIATETAPVAPPPAPAPLLQSPASISNPIQPSNRPPSSATSTPQKQSQALPTSTPQPSATTRTASTTSTAIAISVPNPAPASPSAIAVPVVQPVPATPTAPRPATATAPLPPGAIALPPLPTLNPGVTPNSTVNTVQPVVVSTPAAAKPASRPTPTTVAVTQPQTQTSQRYRVVVEANNSNQQEQIKALVPDAFRSSYQGKIVMQVGTFNDASKANDMIQLLKSQGFSAKMDTF